MIPKIIHQIWLQGEQQIPMNLQPYYDGCHSINDDFQHMFWDEDKITDLIRKEFGERYLELFRYYKVPAQRADFARYMILYIYGGIYLDMDTICKKNLSFFLNTRFFFTPTHVHGILNVLYKRYHQGVFGSVPKHPIYLILHRKLFERVNHSNNVTYSTGTKLFYDSVQEYIRDNNMKKIGNSYVNPSLNNAIDVTIVDNKYLHPCGIFDNELCQYQCDDSYIVHTNYSSWSPAAKVVKYLVKYFNIILILIFVMLIIILVSRKR
jgi:inositol phosphorylceramide mannosyltransferase catalytic subunit